MAKQQTPSTINTSTGASSATIVKTPGKCHLETTNQRFLVRQGKMTTKFLELGASYIIGF